MVGKEVCEDEDVEKKFGRNDKELPRSRGNGKRDVGFPRTDGIQHQGGSRGKNCGDDENRWDGHAPSEIKQQQNSLKGNAEGR